MPVSESSSAPSLAGPWLALLILAVPIATAGALCSLIAPWWVIEVEAGLSARLEQRWLLVVPVRGRDLGTLEAVELRREELKTPGPPRAGGGVKQGTFRLELRHNGGRRTELAAGRAEGAAARLLALIDGTASPPAAVWIGKPLLGVVLPFALLAVAAGLVTAFFVRLLRRG